MKAALVLVLAIGACGALRRGGAEFEQNVGIATAAETTEMVSKVLALHQFELEREDGPPNIYFETRWLDRRLYADEQELGVVAAQARTIVRARPRSATSALGVTYTVNVRVEQRVRMLTTGEWVHNAVSDGARAYAERIISDIRRELDIGVRRH